LIPHFLIYAEKPEEFALVSEPGLVDDITVLSEQTNPVPSDAEFTAGVDNAGLVLESIETFVDKRLALIDSYEFLSVQQSKEIKEQLSDLNTRSARIKDALNVITKETYYFDMIEIKTDIESLNKQILELNDRQKAQILSLAIESYLEDHIDFYTEAVELFEENKTQFTNTAELKDLLDDIEELTIELKTEYDDYRWEILIEKEADIVTFLSENKPDLS
jgi:predicted DNA-binding protein